MTSLPGEVSSMTGSTADKRRGFDMIPGRLRQCLRILRWKPPDLAEQFGCPEIEVAAWLDGRKRAPIAAAAWLEALVKAHQALPPPRLESASNAGTIKLADVEVAPRAIRSGVWTESVPIRVPAPPPSVLPLLRPGAADTGTTKGDSDHEQHPL